MPVWLPAAGNDDLISVLVLLWEDILSGLTAVVSLF